ncbi:MAG: hypothetical protein KAS32_03065 [Candidatus Peribacteraceae bacterium]|nr:hypothetical protein [Candidatus Peribacteraceae bacterium]
MKTYKVELSNGHTHIIEAVSKCGKDGAICKALAEDNKDSLTGVYFKSCTEYIEPTLTRKEATKILELASNALKALTYTEKTLMYLEKNDPMALKQADIAIEVAGKAIKELNPISL